MKREMVLILDLTPVTRVDLSLEVTCPAYTGESAQTVYLRLEEACRRRAYNALYVMLKGVRKTVSERY